MQRGDAMIVALEKGEKILRQIVFVEVGQGSHDAEIERDIAPEMRGIQAHENIAGVHIGMKKAISKYLRKKN